MVKSLTRTDSVVAIIFWMLIIQSVIGLVPAIAVWRTPEPGCGRGYSSSPLPACRRISAWRRALTYAEATVVMPMDFLRLPLSALIGFLLYSERIDAFTAIGAALILAGNLFNMQRRAREPRVSHVLSASPLIGDFQQVPAGLAMHGIRLMPLQPAMRAFVEHLVRPEHRLRKLHEKRDADDHGDDRGQLAGDAGQRDVAEAGRRDRRDGEIERVDIALDAGALDEEEGVDEAGDDEEEGQQVDDGDDRLAPFEQAALV